MNVLHVYKSYYPDTVGGIEQVISQLSRALMPLGVTNRVFTLSPDAVPPVIQFPECDVHRCRATWDVASSPMSLAALVAFREHAAWADVIHYQFPWPFGDLLHLLWGQARPSVVSYQSDIVRQAWLRRAYAPLMQRFLRRVDRVVASSPAYTHTSPVLARLDRAPAVIPNGIDESAYPTPGPDVLARWRARFGEGFMLFTGVLRYYKGLDALVEAADGFAGRIVIAGDGPLAQSLRLQIEQRGLSNIECLGYVSDEDKMALLQLARAFVFPSNVRSEAYGMSLVEAAMAGKPMISCEIGTGTSYINQDGITGWVVPPDDPRALREAMQRLLDHPQQAQALGAQARQRFESHFTAKRMAQAYWSLYREVIDAAAANARCRTAA